MIPVWITDTATVTALGNTLQELWDGLLAGQSGIKPVSRFPVHNYCANTAACIEDLEIPENKSMVRPLIDRLFKYFGPVSQNCTLITASTKAGIDNLERLSRGIPADSQDILPAGITDIISQRLGLKGEAINISAACASSTVAVAHGAALIASGRTEAVLVCCLDLITEFVFSGFSSLQALSPEPCQPFDRDRKGLTLGEGAAALLLMEGRKAREYGRTCLGTVLGWSVSNDAFHITAPAIDGSGLIQAIRQAMNRSDLPMEKIAAICAHGTGTVYNDLMELVAFREVLGDNRIPVYSVKGAVGHTIGAAGGIEVALCLQSLAHRIAPPTVGFSNPEEGAEGLVSSEAVSIEGDYMLTTSSGFGGVNAVIVLGKESVQ